MHSGIKFVISRQESSVIYFVRNMCLCGDVLRGENQKPFNGKIDYTHLMWIDNDIVFTPQQFQKLLDYDKEIVSGVYLMADQMHYATVEKWDENFFQEKGHFDFIKPDNFKNKTGLIEVAYTGLGFMLVKKGVFESLKYPWFEPLFFTIGQCKDFSSEDVAICTKFKQNGFKIYIDPQIRVGHEKKMVI
jgi:GT2 family glycosyltransferase